MIIAFPVIFGIESIWPDPELFADVSHIAGTFWRSPIVWITMFFSLAQVSMGEIIYRYVKDEDETISRAKYTESVIREQVYANSD
jgi:hypothetical protein